MGSLTTHVLDTSAGRPAADVEVILAVREDDGWRQLGTRRTDADGRIPDLLPDVPRPDAGIFRLRFGVGEYFAERSEPAFYPFVDVVFELRQPGEHYHVPLLVSPFGYSTYRGS